MIKVNCTVKSVNEKDKTSVTVNSVDDEYNAVELSIEGHSIVVYAGDIVQAVENCRNKGFRTGWYPFKNQCKSEENEH